MSRTKRWTLAWMVLLVGAACEQQDGAELCDAESCPDGCCDQSGVCQPAGLTACGLAGAACVDCSTGSGTTVDGCGPEGTCTCLAADHPCQAGWECGQTGCTEPPGPVCDPVTQTAPDWGDKDGQCLPSCSALGGDQCGDSTCPIGFRDVPEPSYDCDVCCADATPEMEASTTLTVVDVSLFIDEGYSSPSEVVGYAVTHELYDVKYVPGWVTFEWGPLPGVSPWPPGSTDLTGRIWAFRPLDGATSYQALGWDYILNTTTQKSRANDVPDVWIGTMLSSLCHTNATCNAEERTNIVFWPDPNPTNADGDLIIKPHNVGVFPENLSQQFTALARQDGGDYLDVTDEVEWFIDPAGYPHPGQDTSEGTVATMDGSGLATVQDTWGRVVVKACYPLGCLPTAH